MRIMSIGLKIQHDNVDNKLFKSSVSLLDYDMLIWDPSKLFEEYDTYYAQPLYRGHRNLDDHDSAKIIEDIKRRKEEIVEFIKNNRVIILMLPPPTQCYYASGKYDYSGSGKNRATTRYVDEIDLCSIIPITNFKSVVADGINIELRGQDPFKKYWNTIGKRHYYSAYLSTPIGKPFLFIKGTDKAVGTWVPTEKGIFLILPSILNKPQTEFSAQFIAAVSELVSELQKSTGDYSLPLWANRYGLPGEGAKRKQIATKESESNALVAEIDKLKDDLVNHEKRKILISGSGSTLENQVAVVLKEMGFIVEKGEEGRDDLILKYGTKVAVVEIKGTSKSASEKHAAQLEKWVAEYTTNNDVKPKGVLLVNAYCDIPLNERIEPAFPHQMIKYSTNRDHCLITTTQLLGFYYAVLNDPSTKDALINEFFDTVGVYSKFSDYKSFLSVIGE